MSRATTTYITSATGTNAGCSIELESSRPARQAVTTSSRKNTVSTAEIPLSTSTPTVSQIDAVAVVGRCTLIRAPLPLFGDPSEEHRVSHYDVRASVDHPVSRRPPQPRRRRPGGDPA